MEYLVSYAKIAMSKNNEISLLGVFVGGIEKCRMRAESLAKSCVTNSRGMIIIPRITPMTKDQKIPDALYDEADKYESIVTQMQETNRILERTKK